MFNPKDKSESNYRRMQRFFEKCEIDYSQISKLVVSSLQNVKFILSLDRTNWKFGNVETHHFRKGKILFQRAYQYWEKT